MQVTEYCADGFDALERCLLSDLPVASEEQRQELAQVWQLPWRIRERGLH